MQSFVCCGPRRTWLCVPWWVTARDAERELCLYLREWGSSHNHAIDSSLSSVVSIVCRSDYSLLWPLVPSSLIGLDISSAVLCCARAERTRFRSSLNPTQNKRNTYRCSRCMESGKKSTVFISKWQVFDFCLVISKEKGSVQRHRDSSRLESGGAVATWKWTMYLFFFVLSIGFSVSS